MCHAHPPISTSFAIAGIGLDKAIYPEALVNLGTVPCVHYEAPGSQGIPERGGVGGVIGESIFRQAVTVLAHLRGEPLRQLRRSSARHPGDSEHLGVDQIIEHMSAHAAGIVGGFSGFHRKIQIIPPVPAPLQIVRERALLQKIAQ